MLPKNEYATITPWIEERDIEYLKEQILTETDYVVLEYLNQQLCEREQILADYYARHKDRSNWTPV